MSERYDYREEEYKDVMDNLCDYRKPQDFVDRNDYEQYLNDVMWIDDAITGNGSGSYTFNTFRAKEYVLQNIALAAEVYREYEIDLGEDIEDDEWEKIDCTIRCGLLSETIIKVLDDLEEENKIVYCVNE